MQVCRPSAPTAPRLQLWSPELIYLSTTGHPNLCAPQTYLARGAVTRFLVGGALPAAAVDAAPAAAPAADSATAACAAGDKVVLALVLLVDLLGDLVLQVRV